MGNTFSCPLACGSTEPPRPAEAAGVRIIVCPACLAVALDGNALFDPRRSTDAAREIRRAVLRVRDSGTLDPLTQLLSREAFLRRLAAIIEEARHRHFVSAAALSFDEESLHASLGSRAADEATKALATEIRFLVREGDEVGRIGRGIFGVILRGADAEAAATLAERLAARLSSRPLHAGGKNISIKPRITVTSADGKNAAEVVAALEKSLACPA